MRYYTLIAHVVKLMPEKKKAAALNARSGEVDGGLQRIDSADKVGYTEIAPWSGKR